MGYYLSDEERIEQLTYEANEAERKIDELRDELSAQTARAEEAEASLAEREEALRECNAVCLCGCPESEHESYGEDGESCADESHECLRVAPAVLGIVQRYRVALSNALKPARDEVREAAEEWAAAEAEYDAVPAYSRDTDAFGRNMFRRQSARRRLLAALSRDAKGGEK